ncbi:hypothetical protein GCU56_07080 [Geodermatophilus sabuli]|uniref:DUF1579 domain-containing protein n=1 Tax=Geodermatophilus sabuli TaxID=1564158 RepID=A0A7K3VYH3_9ACTN|nr:hypothetical protein [Geodermatophilus sabuli]NEK57632.1 hypothetical protein [Geodermatophilus sabuli]
MASPHPSDHLAPLAPVIGRWRSSGTVHDGTGAVTGRLAGSDTYRWLPGGAWIAHEVDVVVGDEHVVVHEVIGGRDAATGGWQMHAFDASDSPGVMSLVPQEDGLLLLRGEGVRSWFDVRAGDGLMTTRWERELSPGRWVTWMDMRFERVPDAGDPSLSS